MIGVCLFWQQVLSDAEYRQAGVVGDALYAGLFGLYRLLAISGGNFDGKVSGTSAHHRLDCRAQGALSEAFGSGLADVSAHKEAHDR